MKKISEADTLNDICGAVKLEGHISEFQVTKLTEAFGQRVARAKEVLDEGRVKKYVFQPSGRIVWIVVGRQRDYLVMPVIDYCSCYDFFFQFDRGHVCYHIIAQKLAEVTGKFDTFEDDDQFYSVLIREWKAPDLRQPEKHEDTEENDTT